MNNFEISMKLAHLNHFGPILYTESKTAKVLNSQSSDFTDFFEFHFR